MRRGPLLLALDIVAWTTPASAAQTEAAGKPAPATEEITVLGKRPVTSDTSYSADDRSRRRYAHRGGDASASRQQLDPAEGPKPAPIGPLSRPCPIASGGRLWMMIS